MEKQLLKEDFSILGTIAAVWLVKNVLELFFTRPKSTKDLPIPNKNVFEALNQLWVDSKFKKDVVKIISDEGNFDDVTKQIKFDDPKLFPNSPVWKKINSVNFQANSVAKRIVTKIVQTSSYKRIASKYEFSKKDAEDSVKLLIFVITHPDFTKKAKKYLLQATSPNFVDKVLDNPNLSPWDLVRTGGSAV